MLFLFSWLAASRLCGQYVSADQPLEVPYLKRLGIVSFQISDQMSLKVAQRWPGQISEMYNQIESVVKHSGRFELLNRSLIQPRWSTRSGRKFLRDEFEMNVLAVPHLSYRDGRLYISLQFVGSQLEPIAEESRALGAFALENDKALPEFRKTIKELVYAVINRLPLDMTVTSIQGGFITLSAGSKLGIYLGETLSLERVSVVELHPALGTWRTYKRRRLGQAKIVELRDETSVAKIMHLIEPDILRFGDGARSEHAYSRVYFKPEVPTSVHEAAKSPEPKLSMQQDSVLVDSRLKKPQEVTPSVKPVVKSESDKSVKSGVWNNLQDLATVEKISFADLRFGHLSWKFAAPAASATVTRSIASILNYFEAATERPFGKEMSVAGHVWLGQGSLDQGSYLGGGVATKLLWNYPLESSQSLLSGWSFGPYANIEGMGAQKSRFGGYDLMSLGIHNSFTGKLGGFGITDLAWQVGLDFQPFALGMIGFLSSKRFIQSHTGFGIECMLGQKRSDYAWGGGIKVRNLHFFDAGGEAAALYENRIFAQLTLLL